MTCLVLWRMAVFGRSMKKVTEPNPSGGSRQVRDVEAARSDHGVGAVNLDGRTDHADTR